MSNIPSGWCKTTLGEFLTFQRGHDLPKQHRRPGRVPVIGSGGHAGWHDKAMAKAPGVTIGRAANLGIPTLIQDDFWPLNTTLYVTDFNGNDVRFCFYLMKTLDLTGFNSGSVQPMLNRNYISSFPIVVPDVNEQHLISKALGALDDKIAVNQRMAQTAIELGDSVFLWTVSRSPDWQRLKLGELADRGDLEFSDGYRTKRAEHGRPGIPILRVAEVQDGRIDPDLVDFVQEGYRESMGTKLSRPDDVILTTKGTVGRVALIPADSVQFVYSPQLCFFRTGTRSPFSQQYLYFWLRSSEFLRQARTMKSQTDMADYLSLQDIRRVSITVPEPSAQSRITCKLRILLDKVEACNRENRTLSELRNALLPKLISGELRIKDAERAVEEAV
jgi:type I restriction enzyme S subunit